MTTSDSNTIKLVQLSDLHLFKEPGNGVGWCDACLDLDTDKTLAAVLQQIETSEFSYDAMVVTGDIAQEASLATYRRFEGFFQNQNKPVFSLAGNHDNSTLLHQSSADSHFQTGGHVINGRWLMVFLDSSQAEEEPSGLLSDEELSRLASLLRDHPDHHALLFVHHHPVDISSAWLDKIGINNKLQLQQTLAEFKQVKSVVFGHIHQEFDQIRYGIRMIGTPSTCIQFKPAAQEFGFDNLPPAYRWLELHANGEISTGVIYLNN